MKRCELKDVAYLIVMLESRIFARSACEWSFASAGGNPSCGREKVSVYEAIKSSIRISEVLADFFELFMMFRLRAHDEQVARLYRVGAAEMRHTMCDVEGKW